MYFSYMKLQGPIYTYMRSISRRNVLILDYNIKQLTYRVWILFDFNLYSSSIHNRCQNVCSMSSRNYKYIIPCSEHRVHMPIYCFLWNSPGESMCFSPVESRINRQTYVHCQLLLNGQLTNNVPYVQSSATLLLTIFIFTSDVKIH